MKLVDTSVWIAYWRDRRAAPELDQLLTEGAVLLHPWVLGELALGNLGRLRTVVLQDLERLPSAPVAPVNEVLGFIEASSLAGTGLGWVDVNLIASARLASSDLWTLDQRLATVWRRLS